jgi:hypothetical protein
LTPAAARASPNPLPCTRPTAMSTRMWRDRGKAVGEKAVLSAELGPYTGAFVTDEGEVFGFGLGTIAGTRMGGHGLGHSHNIAVPERIRGGLEREHAVLVRMGSIFGVVLTEEGHVWTFGTSRSGQLGTGALVSPQSDVDLSADQGAASEAGNVRRAAAVLGPTLVSGLEQLQCRPRVLRFDAHSCLHSRREGFFVGLERRRAARARPHKVLLRAHFDRRCSGWGGRGLCRFFVSAQRGRDCAKRGVGVGPGEARPACPRPRCSFRDNARAGSWRLQCLCRCVPRDDHLRPGDK